MEVELISPGWQLAGIGCGLAAFFVWETLAPYAAQRNRGLHAARNLTMAAVNAVVVGLCCAGATIVVAEWTASRQWGLLSLSGLSQAWGFVGGFLLLDLWTYWWHRANHRSALLWRFHRMHHSDPSMDVSTALRFHGGELLLSAALRLPLIAILGLSLPVVAAYSASVIVVTEFHHANIGLRDGYDRALRFFIVSPNMHKVHHSRVRRETDSNYATVFSCWDRLFGSYRERQDYRAIRFGLDHFDAERFQTVKGLALTPFHSSVQQEADI